MKKLITLFLLLLFVFTSCTVKPQKINYGEDACHFCSMTIVDKQHAAELVTNKGKAFKFDATECMVNYMADIDTSTVELYLITNFNTPGELIDAKTASYIISENIPSPMGEFLSGVPTKEETLALQKEKGGDIFTWEGLLMHLNDK